jgi:peptide/nickel transport system permease protein
MINYIARRITITIFILFGSSFLVYNAQAYAGDPLGDLAQSTAKNKEFLIHRLTVQLQLDVPPPGRYFLWLKGVLGTFVGNPDFGLTRLGNPVLDQIAVAIPITLRLVLSATIFAILLGIFVGIISALRQYARIDYSITVITFLCFSLPVFWIAVLLKQYLAIGFNDFLANPVIPETTLTILAIIFAITLSSFITSSRKSFWVTTAITLIIMEVLLHAVSYFEFLRYPRIGLIGTVLLTAILGLGLVTMSFGTRNKGPFYFLGTLVGCVAAAYFPLTMIPGDSVDFSKLGLGLLALAAIGGVIGWFWSNEDKSTYVRTGALTLFLGGLVLVLNNLANVWSQYFESDAVNGRPVPTISAGNALLETNNFWISLLDIIMHLLLPTLGIMLISFAGYVRYARSGFLEIMNLDYIRTARAKGLPERVVVTRHALRNAMIPLTTLIAFDLSGLIGGAFITESIYGWRGMGTLFLKAVSGQDLNLLMGVFFLTSFLALMGNLAADILYGVLDPRISTGRK